MNQSVGAMTPPLNTNDAQEHQRPHCVYQKDSGRWMTQIRNPISNSTVFLGIFDTAKEAEEAYDNRRREFDLTVSDHKKRNQSNDSSEAASTVKGKSDSTGVSSDDPFVSTDRRSMINVDLESMDIIDSNGQLVGEYSSLDDELWIC